MGVKALLKWALLFFSAAAVLSSCLPPPLPDDPDGPGGRPDPQAAVRIFWATDGTDAGTYAIRKTGTANPTTTVELVLDNLPDQIVRIAVDSTRGKIYWETYEGGGTSSRILRAGLDGASPEETLTGLAANAAFHLDDAAGLLYFARSGQIFTMDVFTKAESLCRGVAVNDIVVDSPTEMIYWKDMSGITRATLEGGTAEPVWSGDVQNPMVIDTSNGKIYWCPNLAGGIDVLDLADLSRIHVTMTFSPTRFALDPLNGLLYFGGMGIETIRTDGTGKAGFLPGAGNVYAIAAETN